MLINVIQYLETTSLRFPHKRAVGCESGAITFERLSEAAFALSERIIRAGAEAHEPVLLLLPKSAALVQAIVAVTMSGNVYVPVEFHSPPERLRRIVARLGPGVAGITNASGAERLRNAGMAEDRILEMLPGNSAPSLPLRNIWEAVALRLRAHIDTDPCYVMFTSGSTGEPKGVTISHRSVIDYIEWARETLGVTENDVIGNQAPFNFDNSTLDLYLALSTGATLELIPDYAFAEAGALLEQVASRNVTTVFWVPSILVAVAQSGLLESRPPLQLARILFAGEVMPVGHLNRWLRALPGRVFCNLYGPTEITVDCTYFFVDGPYDGTALPIGYPCRNTDVLVLGEDNMPCATEEIGELCVRGSSLALGYWNAPESTAAAFVQNPRHDRYPERIYRTGDLVRRDGNGCLHFLGRRDEQVKHRGYRIELGEIEAAIDATGKAARCCVLHDRQREEIVAICATRQTLHDDELRRELSSRLPRYMIPARFVAVEELPLTPNGKVDRLALARRHLDQ